MAHPEGELATARACARKGVNMGISSYANYPIKEIRNAGLSAGPISHAIQLYTFKDRELELGIIREAEAQGCTAIFLTADSPVRILTPMTPPETLRNAAYLLRSELRRRTQ